MQTETGNNVPDRAVASWLVDAIMPGGQVIRWERLPGATSSLVDAALLEYGQGRRRSVVVRRYEGKWHEAGPVLVTLEAAVLGANGPALAWPAVPELLALDADGTETGWPTIASTLLPGTPIVTTGGWIDAPASAV